MNTDIETFAHDLYEFHLYEKIRAAHPDETPAQISMRVLAALDSGEVR